MTPKEREAFLAERQTGLGGSDAQHYLSIDPYGCPRLCWYQKRGVPEDYPVKGNEAVLDRGHKLESVIVDLYVEESGNTVYIEKQHLRHPIHNFMVAHVDGIIVETGYIFEAKTMGREIWYQFKKEGIPMAYVAQGQHYCYVKDAPGVTFGILWADGWQYQTVHIERDDELIDMCIEAAGELWQRVKEYDPPDRLDPSCKQCRKCAYRTTCQGSAMLSAATGELDGYDGSLDLTNLVELRNIRDEAKDAFEAEAERVKHELGERTAATGIGGSVTFKTVKTDRLDILHLKADHPELVKRYTKPSVSRPLRVTAL